MTAASAPAHHAPGGGFRNPWPGSERAGVAGLLRWMLVERARARRAPDPDPAAAFPRAASAFDAPRAAPGALTATWVGHSSFLVQLGGWNVLLDPVWGERVSPVPFAGPRRYTAPGVAFDALPPVDLVLLSHDSICFQTAELLAAMRADSAAEIKELRVDGGASRNDSLLQFQADVLQIPVVRPKITETTALGAAYLAGLAIGFWQSKEELATHQRIDKKFEPQMPSEKADQLKAIWSEAVKRATDWEN